MKWVINIFQLCISFLSNMSLFHVWKFFWFFVKEVREAEELMKDVKDMDSLMKIAKNQLRALARRRILQKEENETKREEVVRRLQKVEDEKVILITRDKSLRLRWIHHFPNIRRWIHLSNRIIYFLFSLQKKAF